MMLTGLIEAFRSEQSRLRDDLRATVFRDDCKASVRAAAEWLLSKDLLAVYALSRRAVLDDQRLHTFIKSMDADALGEDVLSPGTFTYNLTMLLEDIGRGKVEIPAGHNGWAHAVASEYAANLLYLGVEEAIQDVIAIIRARRGQAR